MQFSAQHCTYSRSVVRLLCYVRVSVAPLSMPATADFRLAEQKNDTTAESQMPQICGRAAVVCSCCVELVVALRLYHQAAALAASCAADTATVLESASGLPWYRCSLLDSNSWHHTMTTVEVTKLQLSWQLAWKLR